MYPHRPELSSVVGLKGCVKGFLFQKKDFNLLEEPGTVGISSGCPEELVVRAQFTNSHSYTRWTECLSLAVIRSTFKPGTETVFFKVGCMRVSESWSEVEKNKNNKKIII